jgi:hypothetical protein
VASTIHAACSWALHILTLVIPGGSSWLSFEVLPWVPGRCKYNLLLMNTSDTDFVPILFPTHLNSAHENALYTEYMECGIVSRTKLSHMDVQVQKREHGLSHH